MSQSQLLFDEYIIFFEYGDLSNVKLLPSRPFHARQNSVYFNTLNSKWYIRIRSEWIQLTKPKKELKAAVLLLKG